MAKWKRIERNHYELKGKEHTASFYRDPSKEFWWYGIMGDYYGFLIAPNKADAKRCAEQSLRALDR